LKISLGALLEFLCPERTALIFKILWSVRDSNITPVSKNFNITFSRMPGNTLKMHAVVFGAQCKRRISINERRGAKNGGWIFPIHAVTAFDIDLGSNYPCLNVFNRWLSTCQRYFETRYDTD